VATLAGGGRPAAAATLIQMCGFPANQPGTYVLVSDLTCPGNGIIVTADNVPLVLAGHTLTGITLPAVVPRLRGTDADPHLSPIFQNDGLSGFR